MQPCRHVACKKLKRKSVIVSTYIKRHPCSHRQQPQQTHVASFALLASHSPCAFERLDLASDTCLPPEQECKWHRCWCGLTQDFNAAFFISTSWWTFKKGHCTMRNTSKMPLDLLIQKLHPHLFVQYVLKSAHTYWAQQLSQKYTAGLFIRVTTHLSARLNQGFMYKQLRTVDVHCPYLNWNQTATILQRMTMISYSR